LKKIKATFGVVVGKVKNILSEMEAMQAQILNYQNM
tara:strand:- start:17 stop:124 length:108 start_codon:yes stop_codon:yes gene_type:complete